MQVVVGKDTVIYPCVGIHAPGQPLPVTSSYFGAGNYQDECARSTNTQAGR